MDTVKSPYLDDKVFELEGLDKENESSTKQPYSPFLDNQVFDANELENEWDEIPEIEEGLEEEMDYDSFFEEFEEDEDEIEYEELYDDEIEDDFLDYKDDSEMDSEFLEEEFNNERDEDKYFEDYEKQDDIENEELYDDEIEVESLIDYQVLSNKEPLPIPVNRPIPFAPLPPLGSYWPLISSQSKVVSYKYSTRPSKYIGNRSRSFLADRAKGARYHVGIDLYANHKDKVVACQDGVIISFRFFYRSTYALIVEHENIVINYGEVHKDSLKANGLKKGDRVRAGQIIGFAGKMYKSSMLHFEIYRKGTNRNLKWLKRNEAPSKLLNPTKYLLQLKEFGKTASNDSQHISPVEINNRNSWENTIQKGIDIKSNIFQSGKLLYIASTAISKGERDEGKITNIVFYAKHPSEQGQKLKRHDPLAKDWLSIRNNIVRPLLKGRKVAERNTTTEPSGVSSSSDNDHNNVYQSGIGGVRSTDIKTENLTAIPDSLGALMIDTSVPELSNSIPSYKFTTEDARWLARFVTGESGVKNDANGHAVIWTMFNRFGMLRHRVKSWSSFQKFLRLYSTTLQPVLRNKGAAARHYKYKNYVKIPSNGEYYPLDKWPKGKKIPKGQIIRHLELQKTPWKDIHPTIRNMVVNILSGKIPNPGIGIATEFASTKIYYKQKYGKFPNNTQWKDYTIDYAKNKCKKKMKGCTWIGDKSNLNQMKNSFFIDNRFRDVPPSAIKIK